MVTGHDPRVTTWVYPINWIKFDTAFGGYGQGPSGNPQVFSDALSHALPLMEGCLRSW